MKIKIWYYNFWKGFKLLKRSFIQVLEKDGYEFILDEKNPDIVFINSFGPITYNGPAIKIGYVTEDMYRFTGILKKIQEGYFDMVIGNINYINSSKFCKHPLYINSCDYKHNPCQYQCNPNCTCNVESTNKWNQSKHVRHPDKEEHSQ